MLERELVWQADAELELFPLPPSDAERLVDALERFAKTGQGFVREIGGRYRLYVQGAYAEIDVAVNRVRVLRVIRRWTSMRDQERRRSWIARMQYAYCSKQ